MIVWAKICPLQPVAVAQLVRFLIFFCHFWKLDLRYPRFSLYEDQILLLLLHSISHVSDENEFFFNINLSIQPYFDEVHLFPRYKTQYPSYFCWRSTFFAARFEVKSICALFLAFSMFNYCFFLVLFFLSAALSKLISAPNFRREHFAKNFGGNFLIFGIEGFLVHLIYGKFLSQT